MTDSTKINFVARRVADLDDLTDLVEMLFPGNRNQQHAAARILLCLKQANGIVPNLAFLEGRYGISRRTLQRARAKLACLGLIEHVSWMNSRYGGQSGWRLSSKMSTALRQLADKIDQWHADRRPERMEKDEMLVEMLDCHSKESTIVREETKPLGKERYRANTSSQCQEFPWNPVP